MIRTISQVFTILLLAGSAANAAQIPRLQSTQEVQSAVSTFAFGASNRSLLTGETLGTEPGIRVGLVQSLIATHNIHQMGDRSGSGPDFIPVPSLHLAKGLPFNFDVQLSIFPPRVLNYVTSVGASLGWTFVSERDAAVALAVRPHFTTSKLYSGDVENYVIGANVVVSKDYVEWEPYAHAGFAFASGCVHPERVTVTVERCASEFAVVAAAGIKANLPLTLTLQFDMHNLNPAFSLFVGKNF